MRSSHEWVCALNRPCDRERFVEWVEAIQRDAIEAAAKVCDVVEARWEARVSECKHTAMSASLTAATCATNVRALRPSGAEQWGGGDGDRS